MILSSSWKDCKISEMLLLICPSLSPRELTTITIKVCETYSALLIFTSWVSVRRGGTRNKLLYRMA